MQYTNISSWRWQQFKSLSTAPYIGKSCPFFCSSKACKNMSSRNAKKMHLAGIPRSGAFALRYPSEPWFLLDLHLLIGNSNLIGEKAFFHPPPLYDQRDHKLSFTEGRMFTRIQLQTLLNYIGVFHCILILILEPILICDFESFVLILAGRMSGRRTLISFPIEEVADQTSRSVWNVFLYMYFKSFEGVLIQPVNLCKYFRVGTAHRIDSQNSCCFSKLRD